MTLLFQAMSLNPVQVLKYGAEEEKSEIARLVSLSMLHA
jgi:hypothetical protein